MPVRRTAQVITAFHVILNGAFLNAVKKSVVKNLPDPAIIFLN